MVHQEVPDSYSFNLWVNIFIGDWLLPYPSNGWSHGTDHRVPGAPDPADRCAPLKVEHHHSWYRVSSWGVRACNPHQVHSVCSRHAQSRGCCLMAPGCLPSPEPKSECWHNPRHPRPRPAWQMAHRDEKSSRPHQENLHITRPPSNPSPPERQPDALVQ